MEDEKLNNNVQMNNIKADMSFVARILEGVRKVIQYDSEQKQPLILKINEGFIFNLARKALIEQKYSFLVSITGESASGKTTLVDNAVKACLKSDKNVYTVIRCDDYYKDASSELKQAGNYENLFQTGFSFDTPDAIDLELMKQHLIALKNGQEISSPEYDFVTCESKLNAIPKKPSRLILNEGLYVLDKSLLDIVDVKIFVFSPFQVIKDRWFARAISRGKTGKAAEMQFNDVNQTAYRYIRPAMNTADIIINGLTTQEYIEEIAKMFIDAIAKVIKEG